MTSDWLNCQLLLIVRETKQRGGRGGKVQNKEWGSGEERKNAKHADRTMVPRGWIQEDWSCGLRLVVSNQ